MTKINCPLCGGKSPEFYRDPVSHKSYCRCSECDLRFLDPAQRLTKSEEEARYRSHQNDAEDPGYQKFTMPVIDAIRRRPPPLEVLDFGCGDGPVIPHVLKDSGYKVAVYDPFFRPDRAVLERKYDAIAVVEVAEHLYDPQNVFSDLRLKLKKGGELIVMTELFQSEMEFGGWYYRKDPTHVCLYSPQTMKWMAKHFGFSHVDILSNRLSVFTL